MVPMLQTWLLVALGGVVGATARFGISQWVRRTWPTALPMGTWLVNVLGCLGIGLLAAWLEGRGPQASGWQAFALAGLLGSFTTFSTFGYETLALWRDGRPQLALLNAAGQLLLGLLAIALGLALGRSG